MKKSLKKSSSLAALGLVATLAGANVQAADNFLCQILPILCPGGNDGGGNGGGNGGGGGALPEPATLALFGLGLGGLGAAALRRRNKKNKE